MKLERLTSTTHSISHDAAERARTAPVDDHRRVNASEGMDGDRERPLSQELAAADATVATEEGDQDARHEAQGVAAELVRLGNGAVRIMRPANAAHLPLAVDTEA